MNVKIFSNYTLNKKSYFLISKIISPVISGAIYNNIPSLIDGDDTENHISDKYYLYGEFTALYWIWKNIDISHYGFCMADTYFIFNNNYKNNISKSFFNKKNVIKYELNNDNKINSLCLKHDIILSKPVHINNFSYCNKHINSVKDYYNSFIPKDIFNNFLLMLENNNFLFLRELNKYLNSKYYLGLKCFIFEKTIFNEMCQLIFNVADIFEKEYSNILEENKYPKLMFYICDIIYGSYIYHLKNSGVYKEIVTMNFQESRIHISLQERLKIYIKNCCNMFNKKTNR